MAPFLDIAAVSFSYGRRSEIVDLLTINGAVKGQVDLPASLFDQKGREGLVWESVKCYLANQRQGTACTKTRGEVSGTGKKPHRQKHTGHSRHGSRRSPIFVGGGIAWGARPRDYSYRLPKRLRRQSLALALTARKDEQAVTIVEDFELPEPKTREMTRVLGGLNLAGMILLLTDSPSENLKRASRNIPRLTVRAAAAVSAHDVVSHDRIVLTESGLKRLAEIAS
ncbi:50S ribosomal protein L4 [candidate division WOR-3 bacterium]|nr:50S ribosomal protein L4 [candidate division WOR-3 bacterium]